MRDSLAGRVDGTRASQAEIDWNLQELSTTPKHVLVETLAYLSNQDLTPILPLIRVPTLTMRGDKSGPSGAVDMERLTALIPGAELVAILGVPGMIQYTAVEQCAAAWRAFVGRLPGRTNREQ